MSSNDLWLDQDGWDTASWELHHSTGADETNTRVDFGGDDWVTPDVTGVVVTVQIAGPNYTPTIGTGAPLVEDCQVITADTLARVSVRGVIRRDQWIRLRPAGT